MSKVSKNSRRPATAGTNGTALQGTLRLLITTGGGVGAYVLNPATGKSVWAKTGSETFSQLVDAVIEAGMGERLSVEVAEVADKFGGDWDTVSTQLSSQLLAQA